MCYIVTSGFVEGNRARCRLRETYLTHSRKRQQYRFYAGLKRSGECCPSSHLRLIGMVDDDV